ncbi:MAG: ATP-grasp domain-containing protein, partial [Bdellovibrionota bacterium]
ARMLAQAAAAMGISPDPVSLAKLDLARARKWLRSVDAVIFENEFVDCDLLARAAKGSRAVFAPGLPVIRLLQDKLHQKGLLDRLGIPNASWEVVLDHEQALRAFDGEAVLKWSRQGYDGKGVLVLPSKGSKEFVALATKRKIPVFAERRIPFVRELAIVACRSVSGEFVHYPLVISEQERGICRRVLGPAVTLGVDAKLEAQAASFARQVGDAAGLVGAFALELFETADGQLLVNEIAPRVHNSGHFTQNACSVSQFENQVRAALGFPLAEPQTQAAFVMLNLLGPEGVTMRDEKITLPTPPAHGALHWYAKSEIRPSRKLGHLNASSTRAGADEVERLARELGECEQKWLEQFRRSK